MLAGKVVVDFHVLANGVNGLSNITISTFQHSLPLVGLVLTIGPLLKQKVAL